MEQWKVATRLRLMLAAGLLVLLALAGVNQFIGAQLGALAAEAARRGEDAGLVEQLAGRAAGLYRLVADSVINRRVDEGRTVWQERMAQTRRELAVLAERVDTAAERADQAAAAAALEQIDTLYREHFLPTLARGGDAAAVSEIDGRIDTQIDAYEAAFDRLYQSLQAESREAGSDYVALAARSQALQWGAVLLGALLLAGLALHISRSIVRQLGMEPAEAVALAQRVAAGDLSHVPQQARPGSVAAALADMSHQLEALVGQVRGSADSVATASMQIAQGNQDLSMRTEQQASALQETAATMEQLGTAVRHNADHAARADVLARQAGGQADNGGEQVRAMAQTMGEIRDAARRIADLTGVIDGIAFQSNLLALNAAVEAARAGELGRGFAIVAGEVRALAQRSAQAAQDIKRLVGNSVEQAEAGHGRVEQAGVAMQRIVEAVRELGGLVTQISDASREQSLGLAQVNEAVGQIDDGTQHNAALVEQGAAAASSLQAQAGGLVALVGRFRLREGVAP